MKILALAVALILACTPGARANAVIVQQIGSANATTCTFPNAPQNGNIVFVSRAYGLATDTTSVADSNAVALTQLYDSTTSTARANAWYYTVTGSPTKVYTYTNVGATGAACYEIGGATVTGVASIANTFTTTHPWTGTAVAMTANGIAFCGEVNVTGSATTTYTFNSQTLVNTLISGKFGNVTPNATGTGSCSVNFAGNVTGVLGSATFRPSGAASVLQAAACATTTCALGATPTTGNVVSVQFASTASLSGDSVKDSNNVLLSLRDSHCAAANALCVATYDYLVVGTPTATYTITATNYSGGHVVEVNSAQLPGEYGGTTAVSGTISSTLSMGTLDQELCYADAVAAVGTPTLVISDGVNIPTIATTQHLGVYAQASANANASCTYTPGTSLTTPGIVFAAYNGPPVTAGNAGNLWIGAYERPPLFTWPA